MMHKRLTLAYFQEQVHTAKLNEPPRLSEEINLLHEGAIAVAQISGSPTTARKARAIAVRLVDAASGDAQRRPRQR